MNIIDRIKSVIHNPQGVSVANIMSTILVYSLDNYMQVGAAITFLATAIISILTKWSAYQQDKLDRIHKREMELLEFKARNNQLDSKENNITNE